MFRAYTINVAFWHVLLNGNAITSNVICTCDDILREITHFRSRPFAAPARMH